MDGQNKKTLPTKMFDFCKILKIHKKKMYSIKLFGKLYIYLYVYLYISYGWPNGLTRLAELLKKILKEKERKEKDAPASETFFYAHFDMF